MVKKKTDIDILAEVTENLIHAQKALSTQLDYPNDISKHALDMIKNAALMIAIDKQTREIEE